VQDVKSGAADDVLPDGTVVKKGNMINYAPYAMGRMPALWGPDATEFKPERWLVDGVVQPESPFKFPVFQVSQPVINVFANLGCCCTVQYIIVRITYKRASAVQASQTSPVMGI